MKVVVLGGSGRFGRALLPQLAAQGLGARAVGRADGVDLRGRTSLARALDEVLDGADVLVHAATDPRHAEAVDVEGTAKVLAAAGRHRIGHVVYVSIVGVDRTPFGYYRAKLAAEKLVMSAGVPYTVVRSTQWFPFVAALAAQAARFGVGPRGWRCAPADVDELAMLITRRVLGGPRDGTVQFAGPQELVFTDIAREVGGHRVLHLGVPGRLSAAICGGSLVPDPGIAELGSRTWADWLAAHPS